MENGKEYEPDSLKGMQASLDRFFRSKIHPNVVRDAQFLSSRKVAALKGLHRADTVSLKNFVLHVINK